MNKTIMHRPGLHNLGVVVAMMLKCAQDAPADVEIVTIQENAIYTLHAVPGIVLDAPESVTPSRCATSRRTESEIRNHHNRIQNTQFNVIQRIKYIAAMGNHKGCKR